MEALLDLGGGWLARAYAVYGVLFLLLPTVVFAYLPLLAALAWTVVSHSRGRQPWSRVPAYLRRRVRLAVEIVFGLLNPLLYLAILTPSLPVLQSSGSWFAPLMATAWILLMAFWMLRILGAALDPSSRLARAGVRAVLFAALGCVLLYSVKDLWLFTEAEGNPARPFTFVLTLLRFCPLYLIPAVLIWDYVRRPRGLFLLPDRSSRFAVACALAIVVVTVAFAAHRRSDSAVRELVSSHRDSIRAAGGMYDVDPRLVASIVYVTHRDQLSPFRDTLERLIISAWANNLRGAFGLKPPDRVEEIGTDENPLLNRALDISVGLAQIKPRTAQTASVLATGRTPAELPEPAVFGYRDAEPVGEGWDLQPGVRTPADSPIPIPAARHTVARVLLDPESNLEMCALILALYQNQWEAANPEWSLRGRPDILATLYQIGFTRSRPHGSPQSNTFGRRVREVYEQPWLGELLSEQRRRS